MSKQLGVSFDDYTMNQLFKLASARTHGSVHTIIKKAVSQFLKTVNSDSVKDSHNDHSSN